MELLTPSGGNCLAQDDTSILQISSSVKSSSDFQSVNDITSEDIETTTDILHSESERRFEFYNLYINDVVEYISGLVVKKIQKSINYF